MAELDEISCLQGKIWDEGCKTCAFDSLLHKAALDRMKFAGEPILNLYA